MKITFESAPCAECDGKHQEGQDILVIETLTWQTKTGLCAHCLNVAIWQLHSLLKELLPPGLERFDFDVPEDAEVWRSIQAKRKDERDSRLSRLPSGVSWGTVAVILTVLSKALTERSPN